jgi:hypothetical protein
MPYPTSVRLPEDVRRVLRKVAKQNRRTVTEQINFVLQEWIARDFPPKSRGESVETEAQ